MRACCLQSFATMGIRTGFWLAQEGDEHTCETCGQVYRLVNGKWTAIPRGS